MVELELQIGDKREVLSGGSMNKRQRKKYEEKMKEFTDCYVSSYRELRELDRIYHEFQISCNSKRQCDHIWDMYLDEFEDA